MSFICVLLNAFLSYIYLAYYPALLPFLFEPDISFIVASIVLFVLCLTLSGRNSLYSPLSVSYRLRPRITGGLIGAFGLLACYVAVGIMIEQPFPGSPSGQLLATIVDQMGPWMTAAIIAAIGLQLVRLGVHGLRETLQRKTFH